MRIKKNEADPRVIRTRRLLQDAFASLIQEKDFESITVRDIAERATVNRATFYAHFVDKFELLEAKLTESFMTIINHRISGHEVLNEETIQSIFLGVCDFHMSLSTMCQRSYKSLGPVFEIQIKEKIQATLLSFIDKDKMLSSPNAQFLINTASIMLSWGMYGAAYAWNNEGRLMSAETFVKQTMPLVMNGAKELLG
ncbi:TetR/AcrR family transcriptional regulator [Brevibacillus brevis]|uniref:TetR/AcrR family transcriptional regulator n=1 Tax=Brevibacillus brevis TaxID=1393 RepID=UPI000D10EF5E|nr:TetR/AcrR family transcriptional regulator [Brevibacillus brevis]PSJ67827.1 TetR family transcriptional regulator [Brevibacillus brevis]RED22871.1 TetR family transcriptional regulator [Brevibacillus brevis]GEC91309.1 TetR family transcriptional regulator [Brevibacillus brevis]VEF87744.1 DNA-binding transcriptional repressor FabR [Brevibacillus brevis]